MIDTLHRNPATDAAKKIVLVVDDAKVNLLAMSELLSAEYSIKLALNGASALQICRSGTPPDLVLLDIMMPEMDGFEVCRQLKADATTRGIRIIFLTAKSNIEDEQRGFDLGAVDYITKPISPPIALARVRTHLALKAADAFFRDKSAYLEQEVNRRVVEVNELQDVTVLMMASMAEARDQDTGKHIRRTQHYVKILAEALQDHPRFKSYLSPDRIDMLFKSAPLHDIGKVGIPDRILLKPAGLEPEEWQVMKTHPLLGRNIIEAAEKLLGHTLPFLQCAKEISYSHQEKWDGSGYPEGLRQDEIPISARLMAIADVYDALISRRCYKAPLSHAQAMVHILGGRGSHFDPDVADAFVRVQEQCHAIALRYCDSAEPVSPAWENSNA